MSASQKDLLKIFRESEPNEERNEFIEAFQQMENERVFSITWDKLQKEIAENNRAHGWDEEYHDGVRIALIHSEVSEMLEWIRKGNPVSDHLPDISGAEEEAADIIIRLMSMAEAKGWDLPKAVLHKHRFNKSRPYKHGGKAF